jgi:hypothetical protein
MFKWIAVHTQRESVTRQDVTRPTVPLPDGSGTYGGAIGPIGEQAVSFERSDMAADKNRASELRIFLRTQSVENGNIYKRHGARQSTVEEAGCMIIDPNPE